MNRLDFIIIRDKHPLFLEISFNYNTLKLIERVLKLRRKFLFNLKNLKLIHKVVKL